MLNLNSLFFTNYLFEWFNLFIFFIILVLIALLLISLSFFSGNFKSDAEKRSAFESGFMPYASARQKFSVQFYLVSILFILFDLEILFLFPWSVCFFKNLFVSFCVSLNIFFIIVLFFFILILGIVYELSCGALEFI